MRSNKLIPSPSHLKLPAQSIGFSRSTIALDLGPIESAKMHAGEIDMRMPAAVACIEHAQRRVELHDAAGAHGQLTAGVFDTTGLVQRQPVEFCHLIRADHQRILQPLGRRLRLCYR